MTDRKLSKVEVDWEDSVNVGGWHQPHMTDEFCADPGPTLHSIGYIERKTKRYLILAQSVHGTNRSNLLAIPHSAILRIRKVKT